MTTRLMAPVAVLEDLEATLEGDRQRLFDLIRIPSVSADPGHRSDIESAAALLVDLLTSAGLDDARSRPTAGNPVVTASWRGAPGRPTVLVYGHYDVQPPDPVTAWRTPPFDPTIVDGRVYARGASDDKAPLFIPLTVVASYLRVTGSLPVNVVFLLEGEEEVGSPSLPSFVAENRDYLRADFVASADGGMWTADHPSTMTSARGLAALEMTVRGASKDLHSGRHGGGVANPLHALARLIAGLHDPDGRVTVAGFYEDVRPMPADLREAMRTLPFDDDEYARQLGVPATFGEEGFTTLERQWHRPTLEVNGMWGGYQGPGSKTVLPSEAHAKITCRLVADQEPDDVLAKIDRHLEESLPQGVTLEVRRKSGARAYRLSDDHPGLDAVVASLRAVYGVDPWVVGMGGSIPICETFQSELGMDTVFFSFAVGDEDIHAPNEFFRLGRFTEGRVAWAEFLSRVAAGGGDA